LPISWPAFVALLTRWPFLPSTKLPKTKKVTLSPLLAKALRSLFVCLDGPSSKVIAIYLVPTLTLAGALVAGDSVADDLAVAGFGLSVSTIVSEEVVAAR